MVEIFKTDVRKADQAKMLIKKLLVYFPTGRINFDLEDCDKILRIEEKIIPAEQVIFLMRSSGYLCEVLP